MFARLGGSSLFLGLFGSTAYASAIIDIDVPNKTDNKSLSAEISDKQKKNFSTTKPETMTVYDVEMFEQKRGCKFAFTDGFNTNKNYTVREWFNEKIKKEPTRENYWRNEFAYGVFYYNKHCTKGSVLVLEPGKYGSLSPKLSY